MSCKWCNSRAGLPSSSRYAWPSRSERTLRAPQGRSLPARTHASSCSSMKREESGAIAGPNCVAVALRHRREELVGPGTNADSMARCSDDVRTKGLPRPRNCQSPRSGCPEATEISRAVAQGEASQSAGDRVFELHSTVQPTRLSASISQFDAALHARSSAPIGLTGASASCCCQALLSADSSAAPRRSATPRQGRSTLRL